MPIAQGDTVFVRYQGLLADGSEFDRSSPDRPLSFTMGAGQVLYGLELALMGREKGDSFSVRIAPEAAYGQRNPQLIFSVARAEIPPQLDPSPGDCLHVSTDQGELEVTVLSLDEDKLHVDANHPLAGQKLLFHLDVVDVTRDHGA